ncbi:unnamed protein product [Paramecium primaurelia]|uniref:Uncharacterized protein n=1 Tax=Paramecium primaurelia TaxID=5886 RepID=A0A8S1LQ50_PARPR|nr:unnamed protein product [Paramecium primaurelia]
MNSGPINYTRTMKPVVPTYYPSEIRQQSVGKENRQPIKHNSCSQIRFVNNLPSTKTQDSFESQKPYDQLFEKLKLQVIQLQYEQNTLNEQFQIQIKSLNDRMGSNEQSVKQLYDTGIGQLNNDVHLKDKIKQLELKMGEIQLLIINQEQKTQLYTQSNIDKLKKSILETTNKTEIKIQSQLDTITETLKNLQKSQISPQQPNCISQDIKRFQQFNEEVSSYLNQTTSPSRINIVEQMVAEIKPEFIPINTSSPLKQQINNKYKCQMSAISEKTLDDSRSDYQQIQQYELDSNGYLISNGSYVLDQNGQRYQLSLEQINYLKSINVIEEINS